MEILCRSSSNNNVVNLQNHSYAFGSQGNCTCAHQQWLHDILFQYVGDLPLPHIDPCVDLALSVPVPQLSHNCNWVQPSILSQSIGNDFEGFSK
ncbi:hypothetical protein H5410_018714 [Solanum commersonii]|uniref:Uncharacterized protein n=1 Tax=Solanum commersonii TaxID=4109 RepID=A0A9J6A3I3_SOLCO|nr:hypothetical protein H5410_018714 [Solanum commersonii]